MRGPGRVLACLRGLEPGARGWADAGALAPQQHSAGWLAGSPLGAARAAHQSGECRAVELIHLGDREQARAAADAGDARLAGASPTLDGFAAAQAQLLWQPVRSSSSSSSSGSSTCSAASALSLHPSGAAPQRWRGGWPAAAQVVLQEQQHRAAAAASAAVQWVGLEPTLLPSLGQVQPLPAVWDDAGGSAGTSRPVEWRADSVLRKRKKKMNKHKVKLFVLVWSALASTSVSGQRADPGACGPRDPLQHRKRRKLNRFRTK